ncbi:MAG: DinB family protein [Acidobacteriota bacterium]
MAKDVPAPELRILLDLVDEAYDRPAWHGPNLRGALRGLTAAGAAWAPGKGRNSVWAIALHCAYWKYAVRRRLTGEGKRGSFPRGGSNWPAIPAPADAAAWRADLALLDEQHRLLREAVTALDPGRLNDRRGKFTVARLVSGIAAHDLYHAGQVRLLLKLSGAKSRRRG